VIIRCAWCTRFMKFKLCFPLFRTSHGICDSCVAKVTNR